MPAHIRSTTEFGEAIRKARLARRWRQVDLAASADVRQALVSELENGETSARLDTVLRVLAALDLDLAITDRQSTEFDPTAY